MLYVVVFVEKAHIKQEPCQRPPAPRRLAASPRAPPPRLRHHYSRSARRHPTQHKHYKPVYTEYDTGPFVYLRSFNILLTVIEGHKGVRNKPCHLSNWQWHYTYC